MRRVQKIVWVRTVDTAPIENIRPKGIKAQGIGYEKKFGKFLAREISEGDLDGELYSGQWLHWLGSWLQYEHGTHRLKSSMAYAQPDHYILQDKCVLLFECKLTQTEEAEAQLNFLYAPLLQHLYQKPVLKIQVCKNIRHTIGPLEINHPREVLAYPRELPHTWNWIG